MKRTLKIIGLLVGFLYFQGLNGIYGWIVYHAFTDPKSTPELFLARIVFVTLLFLTSSFCAFGCVVVMIKKKPAPEIKPWKQPRVYLKTMFISTSLN